MELIDVKDLDKENAFFSFTNNDNLSSIEEFGLLAKIGNNAKGIESTRKTFFSKGYDGVIQLLDVWLKWTMNNAFSSKNIHGVYDNVSEENRKILISQWYKSFEDDSYLTDDYKKKLVFDIMYNKMKNQIYLNLKLEEGIDYLINDLDENKVKINQETKKNNSRYFYAKKMYGNFSEIDNLIMDKWNMHTISEKTIEKEKIQLISTSNKTDVMSIITYIYENRVDKEFKYDLSDDFFRYIKEKNNSKKRGK